MITRDLKKISITEKYIKETLIRAKREAFALETLLNDRAILLGKGKKYKSAKDAFSVLMK